MASLGDLLDTYEPERLAKLTESEKLRQERWESLPQGMRDRINGINAMVDATGVCCDGGVVLEDNGYYLCSICGADVG